MKKLFLAAAVAALASPGFASPPEAAEESSDGSEAALQQGLDEARKGIAGLVLNLKKTAKKPKPPPPAPAPPITNPVPSGRYLMSGWACYQDGDSIWGVEFATNKCVVTAAEWRAQAEKACVGKCAKVKRPDGSVVVKCGVNTFYVKSPCNEPNS